MVMLRDRIRAAELEHARPFFPPSANVLEIGGARGHQAQLLSQWGLNVTSIDIAPAPPEDSVFPVQQYDGRHIPFASGTFDVVFSSNVLEHVEDVRALLQEAARVLKPGGRMVHILPSATWRWWTIAVYYPWITLSQVFRLKNPETPTAQPGRPYTAANLLRFAWSIAFPHAHGAYPNAIAELYCYSRHRWKRFFERCNLVVVNVQTAGVFYTAYKVLRRLDVPQRKRMAKLLGSSCSIYVLRERC